MARFKLGVVAVAILFGVLSARAAAGDEAETRPAPTRVDVILFHSPLCGHCRKVRSELPKLVEPYGPRVRLLELDVTRPKEMELFAEFCRRTGSDPVVPTMLVGNVILVGADQILNHFTQIVDEQLKSGEEGMALAPAPSDAQAQAAMRERFRNFSIAAVAFAGLIDGVNPCAFTTIVFLLSMVAYLGKSRRDMAIVGVGFTLSVFVTYLLLGFGIFTAVKAFSVNSGMARGLTIAVAGLTFVLAGLSVADGIRYIRTGKSAHMSLGLPRSLRRRINSVIHGGLSSRRLFLGAVGVGSAVAVLESVCTGQVYLPTIVLVSRTPSLRLHALAYLLLYNFMFILPLATVLVVAYFGVRSKRLGELVRHHVAAAKFALAALFTMLGLMVVATL